MSIRGLESNPRALLQQLRADLGDRYPPEAIIKELLQNAEDAEAAELHIGLSPGGVGSTHPLLRGPGLFLINDGSFTAKDAEAICHFGLNYKAGEAGRIGRFGLGLKSVFHLCEAFFYLSSAEGIEGWPARGLVTPWKGIRPTEHWEAGHAEALAAIEGHLHPLLASFKKYGNHRWFCLWLPLRAADHYAGGFPIRDGTVADASKIVSTALGWELAAVLPLLSNVEIIQGWRRWAGQITQDARLFTVALLREPAFQRATDRHGAKLHGVIRVTTWEDAGEPSIGELTFRGREAVVEDLRSFEQEQGWPHVFTLEDAAPQRQQSRPHAAVCLATRGGTEGGLRIRRAVFLPLGEGEERVPADISHTELAAPFRTVLSLHGVFFVDAGRRGADGIRPGHVAEADPPRDVRLRWNQRLFREGTLPLLLPTLDDVSVAGLLGSEEMAAVTGALAGSTLLADWRAEVCREYQWLLRLTADGFAWGLLPASAPFHELPDEPHERLFRLFPTLAARCVEWCLVPEGRPRISPREASDFWPAGHVSDLLDGVPAGEAFFEPGLAKALTEFLKIARPDEAAEDVRDAVVRLARRIFQGQPLSEMRRCHAQLKRVLSRIPETSRLTLDLGSDAAGELAFQRLSGVKTTALLIPRPVQPARGDSAGVLAGDEAVALLTTLRQWNPPGDDAVVWPSLRTSLARQILAAVTAGQLVEVRQRITNLPLFRAERLECVDGEVRRVPFDASLGELRAATEGGLIFTDGKPLQTALQMALLDESVVAVERELADLLLGEGAVPACAPESCARMLSRWPRLDPRPERRRELLERMTSGHKEIEDTLIAPLRYLLHGRRDRCGSPDSLLVEMPGYDRMWAELARRALAVTNGEWRWLAPDQVEDLSTRQREGLLVEFVNRDSAVEAVRAAGPERVDCTGLPPADCEWLLRELPDDGLRRNLAIHETLASGLTALNERTFWDGPARLPETLEKQIIRLRKSGDARTAAIQDRLARTMDQATVLEVILDARLNKGGPAVFWTEILDTLRKCSPEEKALALLRDAAWLPAAKGGPIAPRDVIHLPGLESLLSAVLAVPDATARCLIHLNLSVRNDETLRLLRQRGVLPSRRDSLLRLARELEGQKHFVVGNLGELSPEEFAEFEKAFAGADNPLQGWALLLELKERGGIGDERRTLFLPVLSRGCPADLLAKALRHLRRRQPRWVHDRYLALLGEADGFVKEDLRGLELLNAENIWKRADELCLDGDGVHPSCLVHSEQAAILQDIGLNSPRDQAIAQPKMLDTVDTNRDDWEPVFKQVRDNLRSGTWIRISGASGSRSTSAATAPS